MRVRTFVIAASLFVLQSSAQAQTLNLRDMLTDFLRVGVTLADPPPGSTFSSHAAHFINEDSRQFLALQQFTTQFATQLSTNPLPSPGSGFTYSFDPALGVLSRASDSFGPVYGDRAETIGRGKFNIGVNFSQFTFEDLGDIDLRDGDLRLVFEHEDVNHDHSQLTPFFEGDIVTARLFVKAESDVTAFVMSYGVTDRLDIGAVLPMVDVSLEVQSDLHVERIATGQTSPIHRFPNETANEVVRQSGSASGVGDVALRMKYRLVRAANGGLSIAGDLRLPTGEEKDLLGTGATQAGATLIGSTSIGKFSPHATLGYQTSTDVDGVEIPDELSFVAGFDLAAHPRMTFAVDFLGRQRMDSGVVEIEDATFTANTATSGAPVIVEAVHPRLVVNDGDATSYFGSVGVKINPYGNMLLTLNGLFGIGGDGLLPRFAPLLGIDYSF